MLSDWTGPFHRSCCQDAMEIFEIAAPPASALTASFQRCIFYHTASSDAGFCPGPMYSISKGASSSFCCPPPPPVPFSETHLPAALAGSSGYHLAPLLGPRAASVSLLRTPSSHWVRCSSTRISEVSFFWTLLQALTASR